jgi:hypothetical protein
MQGVGSSAHNDLSEVVLHTDNMRAVDAATGMNRRVNRDDGCGHTVKGVRCTGPPDLESQSNWYCVDHIDHWLCCGSKLSAEQYRNIVTNPERAAWIEETENARMLATSTADKEWEAQTFDLVGDLPEDQVGFDWQTHQRQLNKRSDHQ